MDTSTFLSKIVEPGAVTLFVGPPASGKTHFVLEAIKFFTGKGEEAYLIDTEGISLKRVRDLGVEKLSISYAETLEDIEKLIDLLPTSTKILCIDSLIMPYRLILPDNPVKANQNLSKLLRRLTSLAIRKDLPVVATGHVYRTEEGKLKIVGGDVMLYWAKAIVFLTKSNRGREAKVVKHRSLKESLVFKFKIEKGGIVGL